MSTRILLTGATGFVGRHLYPRLAEAGFDVRCTSRRPDAARRHQPDRSWVEIDLHQRALVQSAVQGVDVIYYVVHAMAEGEGYLERELEAATTLAEAAAEAGVGRIVYLGGVKPAGTPSKHLQSRLATGRALREGPVACIELRAGMIIGAGSASWQICRDLAARLPFMLLPKWLSTRSQPVAIDDVLAALVGAATVPCTESTVYDLPGPETLSATDVLIRIARLRGTEPRMVNVPILTPKLSSYWLKLVSGADFSIAKELVEGLQSDLVATEPSFWDLLPEHRLTSFDAAARQAFEEEPPGSLRSRLLEAAAHRLSKQR